MAFHYAPPCYIFAQYFHCSWIYLATVCRTVRREAVEEIHCLLISLMIVFAYNFVNQQMWLSDGFLNINHKFICSFYRWVVSIKVWGESPHICLPMPIYIFNVFLSSFCIVENIDASQTPHLFSYYGCKYILTQQE